MDYIFAQYQESADYIASRLKGFVPEVVMVLGSGLGFLKLFFAANINSPKTAAPPKGTSAHTLKKTAIGTHTATHRQDRMQNIIRRIFMTIP